MIRRDRTGLNRKIICDSCGESESRPIEEGFKDFLRAMRADGWTSSNTEDGWENTCPDCAEED